MPRAPLGPGSAFVALALYEAFATGVNEMTGERVMPTLLGGLDHLTWAGLRRRVFPSWAPAATFAIIGVAISAARSARRRQSTAG